MATPDQEMSRHDGNWPSVTAVIPTRDRPDLVRRAVGSIVGQHYHGSIECLVVFDQSPPDPTLESSRDGRTVRVLRNTRANGPAGARNTGLLGASGEFLALCDDDDVWLSDKLERQIAIWKRNEEALVLCSGIRIIAGDRRIDRLLPKERLVHSDFVRSRVMEAHSSNLMVHRSILKSAGLFDESFTRASLEDYDWLLRISAHHPVFGVREPLVEVTWHPGSHYASDWETMAVAFPQLLTKHPVLSTDPSGAARLYGQIAIAEAARRNKGAAREWIVRAFRSKWHEPRTYIAFAIQLGLVDADRVNRLLRRFGRGI